MRVVHQLIDYFKANGVLTQQQLDYLAAERLYDPHALYYNDHDSWWWPGDDDDDLPPKDTSAERAQAELERVRPRRGGKGQGSRPQRHRIDAAEICRRLGAVCSDWNSRLSGLIALARQIGHVADWREAALVIRNAGVPKLQSTLTATIPNRPQVLGDCFASLDVDDYQGVAAATSGPAVKAYRTILAATDLDGIPMGQRWLLRETAIRDVFNLIVAKRQLLAAWHALYTQYPQRLVAPLSTCKNDSGFWTFVLIYNTRRHQEHLAAGKNAFADSKPSGNEILLEVGRCSNRFYADTPDETEGSLSMQSFRRAWLYAGVMQPAETVRFLAELYWPDLDHDVVDDSLIRPVEYFESHLFCPKDWVPRSWW